MMVTTLMFPRLHRVHVDLGPAQRVQTLALLSSSSCVPLGRDAAVSYSGVGRLTYGVHTPYLSSFPLLSHERSHRIEEEKEKNIFSRDGGIVIMRAMMRMVMMVMMVVIVRRSELVVHGVHGVQEFTPLKTHTHTQIYIKN